MILYMPSSFRLLWTTVGIRQKDIEKCNIDVVQNVINMDDLFK